VAYLRTVASGNGAKIASAVKIVKAILRKLYSFANNGAVYIRAIVCVCKQWRCVYICILRKRQKEGERERKKKKSEKREREGERE